MAARKKSASKTVSKKVRYAVVGLGHISQVAALPAFKNAKENSELTAFITGDQKKAILLRKKYKNVEIIAYEDYESFLSSGRVDAVYIALPNDLHYEYVKTALQCGVHVLCEKPFTLSSEEARELHQMAERKNIKLMVAYRLHFEPSNLRAVEIAKSGEIGELKYFTSDFSFQVTDPDNIRLKAKRGGGPIWDIGIYCINAARYLFASEPTEVFAMSERSRDKRFSEVDESISVVMRFPDHKLANFTVSFGTSDAAWYTLYGTEGFLCLDKAYEYSEKRELEFQGKNGKLQTQIYKKGDQFGPELVYFSDCVLKNRSPEPNALEGMADVKIVEAINESLRTHRPVKIRPSKIRLMRPRSQQKIFRFKLPKEDVVRTRSPHS
jgi:predicted dehydrogenase